MAPTSHREYDIVLLGATGYTGKYTAEYIVRSQPTNLRWAIAGRSAAKLSSLISTLTPLNPDRDPPAIETASLTPTDLSALARKTRVLINTVGPYSLHGAPVVQACAEAGTHYVDTTGEVPWVRRMIRAHDETAKRTGATLVPQCGFESAVPDVLAYAIAAHIRREHGSGTRKITSVLWDLKSRASGGTLATVLGLLSVFSLKEVGEAMRPYAISPLERPEAHAKPGLWVRVTRALFGVRRLPVLGLASTAVTGSTNEAIIQRSWGLEPEFYGRSFEYEELAAVRSRLMGVLLHWALALGALTIALPPARWVIKKLVYAQGEGPSKEETEGDYAEYRAVGVPEGSNGGKVVSGRLRWQGSMYDVSGVMMVEAARGLLNGEGRPGFVTPATLGEGYLDRVRKAGMIVEAQG